LQFNKPYKAIVIGTSAGGLQALTVILEKLPRDYPIPVIVVQHRIKDQRELLEDVMQSKCEIRIKQADEKERIKSGFVYIAPPDYHLHVERDGSFSLSSDERVRYSRPSIDVLFESAAIVFRNELIAIVLTGANNDGTAGMVAAKKYGALTIAQDPREAEYSMMPASAIEANGAGHILSLEQIKIFLLKIAASKIK
jgi:two-component system chemotaxis response regulator CheB